MKAVITSEEFYTEGGCNACQPFTMATYDVTFEDGTTKSLEELDIPSLIMALAQKNHWEQSYEEDDFDDVLIYQKADTKIAVKETPRKVTFQTKAEKQTFDKQNCDLTTVFTQVNTIATTLFHIEATDFEVRPLEK
ncbi:DUF4809 domain-containing protein [Enterococcus saigonensis]|uniref:DUF4809 domain-containing protein n=1 Tax=Enterococcus saigonensis TaxID=1805431 RepID=A0A679IJ98_9ENTE|nr:DUF4809 family protein [Enterococcus saigonensis]BCA84611.1 DUF4809 domain-containing protein [Enterococcus saigonensis]